MKCDDLLALIFAVHNDTQLSALQKTIFTILVEPRHVTLSRDQIATLAGCAPNSVPRAAKKLADLGYLKRVMKPGAATVYEAAARNAEVTSARNAEVSRNAQDTRAHVTRERRAKSCGEPHVTGTTDGVVTEALPAEIPPYENNNSYPLELSSEPLALEVDVVVVAASSDTPPPPAWQRVLDAVRSPWLDENRNTQLALEGAIVQGWLNAGADEHLDVIPTVQRLIAAKREFVPWKYFTKAVREATARRLAAEAPQERITPFEATHDNATGQRRAARPRERVDALSEFIMRQQSADH